MSEINDNTVILQYKTRGESSPQGKPRVFFSCHPDDFSIYFDEIAKEILSRQNCAIWYLSKDIYILTDDQQENLFSQLSQMQLIVMPITTNLLTMESISISVIRPFAKKHHIPLLLLMEEDGLETGYKNYFGDLQFLDPHANDPTEIPYDTKMTIYLNNILVGDEEEIRKLVAMYHDGKGVARDYNKSIEWQEKLVALLEKKYETEENEENYVNLINEICDLGDRYEEIGNLEKAYACNKKIQRIANRGIKKYYGDRRDLVLSYDRLGNILIKLGKLDEAKNYYSKGLKLSQSIYEETGTSEARRDLSIYYLHMGELYVKLGKLNDAKEYYRKDLDLSLTLYKETNTLKSCRDLSISYERIGDIAWKLGQLNDALNIYKKVHSLNYKIHKETGTLESCQDLIISYSKMGDVAVELKRMDEAREYYSKGLDLNQSIYEKSDTIKSRDDLAVSYSQMGFISKSLGRLEEAEHYYCRYFDLVQSLSEVTVPLESRQDLASSYYTMSQIEKQLGNFDAAEQYYKKYIESND